MERRRDDIQTACFRFVNSQWLVQMPRDYKHTSGQCVSITKKNGQKESVVLVSSNGNGDNLFNFRKAA